MTSMPREQHTAEEIRDEVARLLNAGRKVPIAVPLPTKLSMPSDPFAYSEANWQIPALPGFRADPEAVKAAILAVKARWDLKET